MESRVRASPEQLATLLEYVESHGDLARPLAGSQGRVRSDRLWSELTNTLNAVGGGVSKTTDKWKKRPLNTENDPVNYLEIVDETPQLMSPQPSTSQPSSYQIPTPPPLPLVLTQSSAQGSPASAIPASAMPANLCSAHYSDTKAATCPQDDYYFSSYQATSAVEIASDTAVCCLSRPPSFASPP